MNRSWRVWTFVPILFIVVGVFGLLPSRMDAQAPPATRLPNSVTVSPGPNTHFYKHVMKKADILAALAQIKDSWDLFVKPQLQATFYEKQSAGESSDDRW